MVVFTCNHCGESLRKPAVEKHYAFACRRVKFLTCVDCFKDFREEEYVAHTKCITEEERYAAKGSIPNGVIKKGELKQESWVDMIRSILDLEENLEPSQRNLLETISNYSNIPRKKPKFLNFIKSSSGGRVNMKDVENIWNIIEKYKNSKLVQNNNLNNKPNESESNKRKNKEIKSDNNAEAEEPKKKKIKKDTSNDENKIKDTEEAAEITEKFNFQEKILSILKSKQTMSLKKLQKKVINSYLKQMGQSEVTPKILKKFNKKLKKIPNIVVTEDNITLS